MYVLILDEEQAKVAAEAFRAKHQLLLGLNRTSVVARNQCLYSDNNEGARRIEEDMFVNDRKMEILNELNAQLEAS